MKASLFILINFLITTTICAQVAEFEKLFTDYMPSKQQWEENIRPEVKKIFQSQIYGVLPSEDLYVSKNIATIPFTIGDQEAIMKQIELNFHASSSSDSATVNVLLITPIDQISPVFVGINSYGNHTIHSHDQIEIHDNYVKNKPEYEIFNNHAGESARGVQAHRWPVERILKRGYGLATFHISEIYPDRNDGEDKSNLRLFEDYNPDPGQRAGALAMWAWAISRVIDHLQSEPLVNKNQIFVIGHSRRGKAALLAGAMDERIAAVFSNDSGCGGAALSKSKTGESVAQINDQFPHWFAGNFKKYNNAADELPVDQHLLLALVAPRLLYVASAEQDAWADPASEFLSARIASAAWNLYDLNGLEGKTQPEVNIALNRGSVGYHIRSGNHDLTRFDWERFMDFTDIHFKN
ncbi:glucuronyl esterase domain-containing protein [Marinigracilibium pacificum]|uniref:Acetylxylan esterase n=1 Tax=Marinigracilibium pacificum TaxID=2729599 RepID=A0A848IWL6_9BACT|nr:acetylxylan esterase [Marinigracilibium pacificum]NMM47558.1 acetylxylan esterase [Marinigracilibium pacificum]